MADDPSVNWVLANGFGIQIDESDDVWHSGHVSDVVEFEDHNAMVVSTQSGGVWMIDNHNATLQLSDTWDNPDVQCLALGPDGPRHLFAGCTVAYDSERKRKYKPENGSSPVIMETDAGSIAPLLEWRPVTAALPATAGRITRIVVIRNLRRIVVACAKVRAGDTGGIFWATIPPTRFNAGDPPRLPYAWKKATIDRPAEDGFWDLAVASTRTNPSRDNLEDQHTITLVAGGYYSGGLFTGRWDQGELVFTRPSASFDDGTDATALLFDNCGTSSVSSCEGTPTILYAACAWPDGRLNSLLRSQDGGWHWTLCAARKADGEGPLDLIQPLAGDQGRAWNNCISAHPTNTAIAALGWQNGLFLTFDGGKYWKFIDEGKHLHHDLHALRFSREVPDSFGNLLIGSDGGLAKMNIDDYENSTGQPFRSDYNRNLPTLQCYSTPIRQFYGTVDASADVPGIAAAGLQDNGNVTCRLRPVVEPWTKVDGGDGGWNAFIAGNGYVHNIEDGAVQATAPLGPAYQTATIPITFPAPGDPAGLQNLGAGATVVQPTYRNPAGQLLVALAASGSSNLVYGLFAGAGDGPPYNWELIATLPAGKTVGSLGSFCGDTVYVGTEQGNMYVIGLPSGAVIEQKVALPKPSPSTRMQGGNILRIVGFDETKMFAVLLGASEANINGQPMWGTPAVQGYILRLDGDTWTPTASTGLPNEYFYGFVAVSTRNTALEHALLVSTDDAVYLSRDDGQTWRRASAGLPRRPHCGELRFVIDNQGSANIYLGTFGRSLWIANLA